MIIPDSRGNLHAGDGKFTNKDLKEAPGANDALQPVTEAPMRFHVPGAQANTFHLNDSFALPAFPEGLPESSTEFSYDEHTSELILTVQNTEEPQHSVSVSYNYVDQEVRVDQDSYYASNETEDQREQFDEWAEQAFLRGRAILDLNREQNTAPQLMDQVNAFAAGKNPNEVEDNFTTHRDRFAARMEHALSGYLDSTENVQTKTENLSSVLSNLRHWARKNGLNFNDVIADSREGELIDNEEDGLL